MDNKIKNEDQETYKKSKELLDKLEFCPCDNCVERYNQEHKLYSGFMILCGPCQNNKKTISFLKKIIEETLKIIFSGFEDLIREAKNNEIFEQKL